ncbi:MAG: NusG domain II-containing protein [Eubacteriales bacterium]|nr:NusG domain II-containing protein [Eubacteriales bacterium]
MKRGDIIIILALLAIGLAGVYIYFFLPGNSQGAIVIQVDGREFKTYPLFQEGRDEFVDIQGINGITRVHLQDGRVRVVESACPDKICVETGWISNSARPIACLPNRVIIKIIDYKDGDIDLR